MHRAAQPAAGRIAVVHAEGHFRVVATAPFAPGEPVLEIEGAEIARPSRWSIQVDEDVHLEVPRDTTDLHAVFARQPWRFLNHSCAPNAAVRGRTLVAVRAVARGEEITFDYNTTELEMATPFDCRCGCGGRRVAGFVALASDERERLRPLLAPHLLRRLA